MHFTRHRPVSGELYFSQVPAEGSPEALALLSYILRKNENEFASDFRKLSRFSLSCLVAIAAKRYLEELLRNQEVMYNYTEFPYYAISQRVVEGIICWELHWGNPGNVSKGIPPPRIYRRASSLK
jgi:hypothetical protein